MNNKNHCNSSCDRAASVRNGARIVWVDVARGVAMLAILLFHTEMYYTKGDIIPYSMYVENFLALFFFVSGYLFVSTKRQFSLRGKLVSIAKRLIVPYVLFVSLMAVPKAYAHGDDLTLWSFLGGLVSGRASWFVSALIVVSLYYALVEHLLCRLVKSRGHVHNLLLTLFAVLPLCCVLPLHVDAASIPGVSAIAVLFVHAGRLYRQAESWIDRRLETSALRKWLLVAFAVIVLFVLKSYEICNDVNMTFYVVVINSYPLFYADTLLFCLLAVTVLKSIPYTFAVRPLVWVGAHSLVYYFVSGGVPIIVSRLMTPYDGTCYGLVLLAFMLVCLAASAITWVVYKFFPWAVGRW